MGVHSFKVSTLMNVCINALSVRNIQGYGLGKGIHSLMVSTLMNVCINALCVRNVQGVVGKIKVCFNVKMGI